MLINMTPKSSLDSVYNDVTIARWVRVTFDNGRVVVCDFVAKKLFNQLVQERSKAGYVLLQAEPAEELLIGSSRGDSFGPERTDYPFEVAKIDGLALVVDVVGVQNVCKAFAKAQELCDGVWRIEIGVRKTLICTKEQMDQTKAYFNGILKRANAQANAFFVKESFAQQAKKR